MKTTAIGSWLLASMLLLAGCTAHRAATRQPGTGDLAFRLSWQGTADLDISVREPSGTCISFYARQSPSGGDLDVDCNGTVETLCEHPIENVYWPVNAAPAGDYLVWVRANSMVSTEGPVAFRLQLLRGREVFWEHQGAVEDPARHQGPFSYRFPDGTPALATESEARPCGAFAFLSPPE